MNHQPDSQSVREQIAHLAYLALTHPWPSKSKDGGIEGARAFRVLVAVLREADARTSLTVVTGLDPLSLEVGITRHSAIRDALFDLDQLDYLSFKPGRQDSWARGTGMYERGRPSVITLIPRSSPGTMPPRMIPDPSLDMFVYERLGNAGYLALTKLWFEWTETDQDLFVGVNDLVEITGMNRSRAKRLLPMLAKEFHATKEGSKYHFDARVFYEDIDRSRFSDSIRHVRKKRIDAMSKKRTSNPNLTLVFPHPRTGEFVKLVPVDFFSDGQPRWSKSQVEGYPLDLKFQENESAEPFQLRLARFQLREELGQNEPVTLDHLLHG